MKNISIYLSCLLFLLVAGCAKSFNSGGVKREAIQVAKSYFDQQHPAPGTSSSNNLALEGRARYPNWKRAFTETESQGTVVIVPIRNEVPFLLHSPLNRSVVYNSETVSRLYLYKDVNGRFTETVVHFLPDSVSTQKKFSGLLLTESWDGLTKQVYQVNTEGNYRKVGTPNLQHETSREASSSEMVCLYAEGWNSSADDPEGYHWTELIGCFTLGGDGGENDSFLPGSIAGIGGGYASGDGGGWTSDDNEPELPVGTTLAVDGGNNPVGNVKEYFKCFSTSNTDNTFAVRVCVSQPVEGTRSTWKVNGPISTALEKNPVFVGHAFLFLTQSGAENIMRNVGFYPKNTVMPSAPSSPGMLNNDEVGDYNISVTVGLTSAQFNALLAYIEQSSTATYNLNSYNCTDFVIEALKAAGYELPRTTGKWPGGSGLNPGDLGEDLRSMALPNGMVRNTSETNHINQGICP